MRCHLEFMGARAGFELSFHLGRSLLCFGSFLEWDILFYQIGNRNIRACVTRLQDDFRNILLFPM